MAPKPFEANFPGEPQLVKIGIVVNFRVRISGLKMDCGPFGLERVDDHENYAHRWCYKIEEFIYSELANFKRDFKYGKFRASNEEDLLTESGL
jgi:hypothetical protein